MAIKLTSEQFADFISKFQKTMPAYYQMYQYIYDNFGNQMPQQQRYWFQQAAQINQPA